MEPTTSLAEPVFLGALGFETRTPPFRILERVLADLGAAPKRLPLLGDPEALRLVYELPELEACLWLGPPGSLPCEHALARAEGMTRAERARARGARSLLLVEVSECPRVDTRPRQDLGPELGMTWSCDLAWALESRRGTLQLLRALLSAGGLFAQDLASQRFWTRASLDQELALAGPLDIRALYTLELREVADGSTPSWAATRGLAELGGLDVDVLNPSAGLTCPYHDFFDAWARNCLDSGSLADTRVLGFRDGRGGARLVPVEDFTTRAEPFWSRRVRDPEHPGLQGPGRVVPCDPEVPAPLLPAPRLSGDDAAEPRWPHGRDPCGHGARRAAATLPILAEVFPQATAAWARVRRPGGPPQGSFWLAAEACLPGPGGPRLAGRVLEVLDPRASLEPGEPVEAAPDEVQSWLAETPAGLLEPGRLEVARELAGSSARRRSRRSRRAG